MERMIDVLVVEPLKKPYVKTIEAGLQSMQHEVDGYIQAVYPFEDPVALICNEEAKIESKPLNRVLRDDDGCIYDVVAGTFFLAGLEDGNFGSLCDELIEKYTDYYKVPEAFAVVGDKIVLIELPEKGDENE